jgi:hypothetical protein
MSNETRNKQIGGDHYLNMGIQPWDAMKAWMSIVEYRGYLRGNALKYIARAGNKGAAKDDYRKAAHYLEELVNTYEV